MNPISAASLLPIALGGVLAAVVAALGAAIGAAEGDLLGPSRVAAGDEAPPAVDAARAYPRTALTTLWLFADTLLLAAASLGWLLGNSALDGLAWAGGLVLSAGVARALVRRRHFQRRATPRGPLWPALALLLTPVRLLRGVVRWLRGGGQTLGDRFVAGDGAESAPASAADLDLHEQALLARVRAFGSRRVRDVMTPRIDAFSLPTDMPIDQLVQTVEDVRYARVPMHRQTRDDVAGILYIKDLISRPFSADFRIESILHPPEIVSADAPLDEVLREMRRRRVHLSLVFDEMGALLGLVTLEDLLEELFGEIRDESDDEEPEIERHGRWLVVSGRVPIATLGRELGRPIAGPDRDGTLGGLLMAQAGRIPRTGEEVVFDGLRFTVERREGLVLRRIRVENAA